MRPPRMCAPVFVAYADIPSARRALSRVTALLRTTHPAAELQPMLWRFDQLEKPRWRDMAWRDAAQACALVLAVPRETAFDPRIDAWTTALLGRLRGTSVTILALVGETDAWTISLARTSVAPAQASSCGTPPREVFASVAPNRIAACAA